MFAKVVDIGLTRSKSDSRTCPCAEIRMFSCTREGEGERKRERGGREEEGEGEGEGGELSLSRRSGGREIGAR